MFLFNHFFSRGMRLWRDCQIRLERECAAAWLSTLGGAFSALGDYSQKFVRIIYHFYALLRNSYITLFHIFVIILGFNGFSYVNSTNQTG